MRTEKVAIEWRTLGYVASFTSPVYEPGSERVAFQRVKVGDLWFQVVADADRRYINIVNPLRSCMRCGQESVRPGIDRDLCLRCATRKPK
jgi:hypothetical protein